MRDAILVEKIIELMSIARIATGQDTHPREFAIAAKSTPSHDQRIDDRLAHARNFRQRAAKFRGWNMEYFGLIRCDYKTARPPVRRTSLAQPNPSTTSVQLRHLVALNHGRPGKSESSRSRLRRAKVPPILSSPTRGRLDHSSRRQSRRALNQDRLAFPESMGP